MPFLDCGEIRKGTNRATPETWINGYFVDSGIANAEEKAFDRTASTVW